MGLVGDEGSWREGGGSVGVKERARAAAFEGWGADGHGGLGKCVGNGVVFKADVAGLNASLITISPAVTFFKYFRYEGYQSSSKFWGVLRHSASIKSTSISRTPTERCASCFKGSSHVSPAVPIHYIPSST